MVSAASLDLTLNVKRVAQRLKKQSVDYTSVKEKLLHSWRYKTLAVIKRHKTTYLLACKLITLILSLLAGSLNKINSFVQRDNLAITKYLGHVFKSFVLSCIQS